MSLLLWLPLTNNKNNQGLARNINTFSSDGLVALASGKIGQCYKGCAIYHLSEEILSNKWTIATWIKVSSWGSNNDIILCKNDSASTSCQFYFSVVNGNQFNLGINGASSNGARYYAYTFSADIWYHVAATYDGSKYAMYLNGNIVKSGTCTSPFISGLLNIGIGCRSTTTDGIGIAGNNNGKCLNDVRIYDEALSPKEVKELAKGLVLHYTLNRGGFGQDNLSINSGDLTLWNKESGITCVWDDTQQMFKIDTTTRTSSRWGIYQDVTCEPNTIYTFSVDGKKVEKTMYLSIGSFASGSVTWPPNHQQFTNNRQRLSYTFTTGDNHTIIRIYLAVYPTSEGSNAAYYALPKLERGSTATPWIPNSADDLYSAMGLDNGIEYDVSGYGNNGSVTGSLAYSSDTPRYLGSTYFNGSSYISTPAGSFNWFDFNQCTVSAWMKPTVKPSSYSGSIGISHNYDNSHKAFAISNHGGNFVAYYNNGSYSSVSSGYTLPLNEWHHCVATLDGTTVTLYVDGVLKKTQTINWGTTPIADTNRVQVAVDFPGSDEKYTGYYSDVRIYATALSADDVLTLYNTPISIANNGTLLTQGELSEV